MRNSFFIMLLLTGTVSMSLMSALAEEADALIYSSTTERYKTLREELLKNPPGEDAPVQDKLRYLAKLANAEARLRNYQQAEADTRKRIELDPDGREPHDSLSVYLGKQGKFDEAIAEAEKAIALSPSNTMHASLVLASWEYLSGKKEAALTRVAGITPPSGRWQQRSYYGCIACFYATCGDEEKLKDAIKMASAADDDGSEADFITSDIVFDPYRKKDWFIQLLLQVNKYGDVKRDAIEQMSLGVKYQTGDGVPKDTEKAVALLLKAAEQGSTNAQVWLGAIYENGAGVEKNAQEAEKWFRKAAEQNDEEGEYRLGCMYQSGDGVPQDLTQATKWFRKAAEHGSSHAQLWLAEILRTGTGAPQNAVEAEKWYRAAAEQGDAAAQYGLGWMYHHGDIAHDAPQAAKWYRKGADQGHLNCQLALAGMYLTGEGVPTDYAESVKWYQKAAEQKSGSEMLPARRGAQLFTWIFFRRETVFAGAGTLAGRA